MAKKNKPKFQTIKELEEEKNQLYATKENPKRLIEIIKKLDFLYFGIK